MNVQKVESTEQFERSVESLVRKGYTIQERDGYRAFMQRNYGTVAGHIITAVLTIWWTFGIGNLLYALWCRFVYRNVLVKLEAQHVKQGGVWP